MHSACNPMHPSCNPPRAQLDLTECDETFRLSRDEVARCRGRANTSARQIFTDFGRRHAEARASAGASAGVAARVAAGAEVGAAARAAAGATVHGRLAKAAAAAAAGANAANVAAAVAKLAPECGATLVLNLGGLHTAAWGGELTMAGYGGAVRKAIRLALGAGFEHVVCLSTAAAHPVAYPPLESMPPLFFGLNAPRTHRTAELATAVAAEFPRHPMSENKVSQAQATGGSPEASLSARSCLELPQALANLCQSASWATLAGHTGPVSDTGAAESRWSTRTRSRRCSARRRGSAATTYATKISPCTGRSLAFS